MSRNWLAASMMKCIYVVDTNYLLELFSVPKSSSETAIIEVKKRFKNAAENGALFMVPLPCIFELGNHIADVDDGNIRYNLVGQANRRHVPAARKGLRAPQPLS